jgi:class 3 adenylate cyclase/tetratricopeptide (TPR) repeat protein
METSPDALACFLPTVIKRRLCELKAGGPAESRIESLSAAVLFADISGFSKLASKLAEFGPEGAEELTRILNAYYGQLVDIVQAHGGDIVNFAGDAILCVWPTTEIELPTTIQRAVQGCLEVQEKLNNYEVVPGVRLSLRMAVGAGSFEAAQIGGVENYWQLVLVGKQLDQLWKGDKLTRVGDVVLSSEAWSLARTQIDCERLADGYGRVRSVPRPLPPTALPRYETNGDATVALRSYVPRTVLARVDAGQANYLADLRRITVLFIKFQGVDASQVSQLQAIMEVLQSTMARYEGTVVQLMTDDKGTVGIVCFGLPPHTHEDDAVRAILAAEAIQADLATRGWQAGIGIATGRVFCGPLGSASRRIYTIIGNRVNLAARLMQHALTEILCDDETERATRGRVKFHPLPRFVIKGIPEPVPVFRPTSSRAELDSAKIIGRLAERNIIEQALEATKAGSEVALSIEGEGGIGKSTLLESLIEHALILGLRPLFGACSSIEKQTPYYVWRAVFAQLLGLDTLASAALRRARVMEQLPSDPEREKLFALLNPLLGVDFPENEIVAQLDGRTRAENLHSLLLGLLEKKAADQALVIILDDVQWMDSASWRFMQLAHERISPLCLTISMRPLKPPHPEEYTQLVNAPRTTRLKLDFLSRQDCLGLARRTLGIAQLSDRLADYCFERSQGNPFFVRELANYMRDAGLVAVSSGCCDLHESADGDRFAGIPTAIGDLITSRIDQLSLSEQMTLKTASVIGRSFPHPTLKDVYPVVQDREQLIDYLQMLERQDLTGLETADPILKYLFKHVTIQQTAYNQLPIANRRQLHREVALWYETRHQGDPSYFPLLAYHWGKTEDAEKHIEYLAKSGDEALRGGANREAEKFFNQALQRQQEKFGEPVSEEDRLCRARWQRRRGDALYHLGLLPESRTCLQQALVLLGRPMAIGKWKLRFNTLLQVGVQTKNRLLRRRKAIQPTVNHEPDQRAQVLQEAALANQRLARICYFENELPKGVNHILRAVNEGEAGGTSPELSRAYGKMCVCMSLLPIHFLAEHYADLAISTARATNDLASIADAQATICMHRMGAGQWKQVTDGAEECVRLSRQLADMERLAYGTTTEALQACFQGQFVTSLEHFKHLFEIGSQSGGAVYQAWGLCGQGECQLRLGEFDTAIGLLEETGRLLQGKDDRTEEVRANGLLSLACWRYGQEFTALQHAATTLDLIANCTNPTCTILEGFAGPAEVYLANWERNSSSESCRTLAIKSAKHTTWYAKVFAIGRPRARRNEGLVQWLLNHPDRARKLWTQSLADAERLALPFEAGLAHLELGRHADAHSPDRNSHLRKAIELFDSVGTPYEKRMAEAALGN